MAAEFAACPEAVTNTLEVAERCNLELSSARTTSRCTPVQEGETLDTLFARACWTDWPAGLLEPQQQQQLALVSKETETAYRDRLTLEIDVIRKMGFSGYFLIVADFINWAKEQQILVARAAARAPAAWPPTVCPSPTSTPCPTASCSSGSSTSSGCPCLTLTWISARSGATR